MEYVSIVPVFSGHLVFLELRVFSLNPLAIFNYFHLKENNERNWKEVRRKIADLNTTELLRILKHGKSKSHHTPDGQCTSHTECLIY